MSHAQECTPIASVCQMPNFGVKVGSSGLTWRSVNTYYYSSSRMDPGH